MKHRFIIAIAAILLFSSSVFAEGGDEFANSAIGKQLIQIGLKFLDNPGDFFANLHSDNEDFSPLPKSRHGSVRFNFFPTFLPFTWGNINLKAKIFNEKEILPQIDVVGTYGDLLGLKYVSSDVTPSFTSYSFGATASKSVNEKTRLYGGIKYSTVNLYVKLSTPVASGEFSLSSLDFKVSDTFLFAGIANQVTPDKIVSAQLGYGFNYNKIVSRLMVSHKHLDIGVDIYPEGLFVIHPFIAWHWYF
jgi:hypothetical protein